MTNEIVDEVLTRHQLRLLEDLFNVGLRLKTRTHRQRVNHEGLAPCGPAISVSKTPARAPVAR